MTPETVDSLKEALTPLMEKLGATGEYAWQLAIRQQYVEAAQAAAWPILLLVAVVLTSKLYHWVNRWRKAHERTWDNNDLDIPYGVGAFVWICLLAVLIVGTVVEGTTAIGRLINPEWYALEMLLKTITGAGQ